MVAQPRVRGLLDPSSFSSERQPLAVDVGYGSSHTTTVEWARWLRTVSPGVRVLGLEIDPSRVLPPRDGVEFALGGFELAGHKAELIRAFNVLRQYDVAEVLDAWAMMQSRLNPGGLIMEGTCDELGRRSTWVMLDSAGPQTLTMAWDPDDVERPSDIAERLPKALIHENTPGHKIFEVFSVMDAAWDRAASYAPFGPRVRWRFAREDVLAEFPASRKLNPRRRMQDNLLTLPWELVSDLSLG